MSATAADVLVVGEALIDIVRDDARATESEHVGGSPANVALGVSRLGATTRLRTALGDDARGRRIAGHLESSGVLIDPASWSLAETSTAHATIRPDGAADYVFRVEWPRMDISTEGAERVLHIGSIAAVGETGFESVREAVASVSGRLIVSFDPNIRPALLGDRASTVDKVEALAALSDIVKLSDDDAAWLYPGLDVSDVLVRMLSLGADVAVVTRGGDGVTLASAVARADIGAPSVEVRDTVGAGDSFSAALIDMVVRDPSVLVHPEREVLQRLGYYAATAAAITVQREGADPPSRRDLDRVLGVPPFVD
ncbi:PfkB family carbohydrate kinase [Microbacterium sp. SLBN-146]|uniref:PfkB family carbohydrate kinase n=1 Tax=Microbacterium sp. SLBN-146 TaxID=2768457 RepID=UPI0011541901|nr:PfkB family carbohydrate kinase [Microbacterium sp. SLBN-146]TQJ31143.1 fructokinase [Microbacterium sp. SLBN-146]